MSDVYDGGTITHQGRLIQWELSYDQAMGPPWKEHDGHGPVRDDKGMTKQPGERKFGSGHLYDWQSAMKKAREESWGYMGVNELLDWFWKYKRAPTKGQLAERAVQRDFDYLADWCDDKWHWCMLHVVDVETGVEDWLGGLESNEQEYLDSQIEEMAEGLYVPSVEALLQGKRAA